jgi:imidazolonepropionase-like amidohydrolase
MHRTILALACAVALIPSGATAHTVVRAGKLIDGTGAPPRENVSIVVDGDRIVEVREGFAPIAQGDTLIDLSNRTVLPGLIDMHVHITVTGYKGDPIRRAVTQSGYDVLIDGVNDARATLLAGFTSIRSVGDNTYAVVALKKAVADGKVPGPRMWVAGEALGPTGGHSDPANGLIPDIAELPHARDAVIDGPDEAQHGPPAEARRRGPDQDHAFGRGHVDR